MNKYNIEGNISFYDELYKSLDDDVGQDAENEEICLITNMPLTDTHFKMQCGHKFNYKPLFLDIKNHKQKFRLWLKVFLYRKPAISHKNSYRLPQICIS